MSRAPRTPASGPDSGDWRAGDRLVALTGVAPSCGRRISGVLALAALAALAGCGGDSGAEGNGGGKPSAPAGPPPNVLVITLDTLRADRVGCYGGARATTPHLDAFAAEGVRFEQAFAASSFTPPTHASILTGRYPAEHGLLHWNKHLGPVPTAAALFAAAGYRTGAFTPMPTLLLLGLDRGFSEQQSPPYHQEGQQIVLADADAVNAAALPWLTAPAAATGGKPFFAWVHYYDAHRPYGRQGQQWSGRFTAHDDTSVGRTEEWYQLAPDDRERLALDEAKVALIEDHYDGGLAYLDDRVGALLDGLRAAGVLEHTLVVILADHGEVFDEHEPEWFSHDPYLFDENVHIPFLLRFPDGRDAGRQIGALVSQVDVLPTLLAFAGLAPPAGGLSGFDLLPLIDGGRPPRELVFADRIGDDLADRKGEPPTEDEIKASRDRQFMVRSATRKLVVCKDRGGSEALFATGAPGGERTDLLSAPGLAAAEGAAHAALKKAFGHWYSTLVMAGAGGAPAPGLDADEQDFLRTLGYVGGSESAPAPAPTPEPKQAKAAPHDARAAPHEQPPATRE
ncbi:MAG TPA: sulfatase, partial [Planctomycetota bacterium]|nr:sulfatase [Planctomycetota bacterium]